VYLRNAYFFNGSAALVDLAAFQSPDLLTIGRTPWTSDVLVVRTLPKHRTTQTHNKHIYTPNIHAVSGIRTHDHSVRASENSSYLRPRGHCDRRKYVLHSFTYNITVTNLKKIYLNQTKLLVK
jgi:hypothetical protein